MEAKKFIDVKDSDLVEYFLYPNLADWKDLNAIEAVLKTILEESKKLSEGYIWHNDSFNISTKSIMESDKDQEFHFYGTLNYGENIEDEWFLVHVLLELTKRINGLVVRIKDTDGEFILIEAAEHLPDWVSPETSEDRVFLYSGHIHLLPYEARDSDDEDNENFDSSASHPTPVTKEVLNLVRSGVGSCANTAIETAISNRIGTYPQKLESLFHRAPLYVPVGVAALLKEDPLLVTAAVRAFCDRDLIDIRTCRAMKFFPPEHRVKACVKFTKCSYAMLLSSKYVPDKRTGWNLPPPLDSNYKSHLLGVKLACGFEILLSQSKKSNCDSTEDLTNDKRWAKFKANLEKNNYFRGLLEHSNESNQLLNTAMEFYRKYCQMEDEAPSRSNYIADLLAKIEIDAEKLRIEGENEVAALKETNGEDDSWINVTRDDLDRILAAKIGLTDNLEGNNDPEIAKHLKNFINHVSGLEGAEFPTSRNGPKRPPRTKKKNVKFSPDTKQEPTTGSQVKFEPEGFMQAVDNILNFSIPEDNYWDSEGSGMSSYEDESDSELMENKSKQKGETKDQKMISYMKQMDCELSSTAMGKSFITKEVSQKATGDDEFEDIETFKPVDIDMNALQNILMSYQAQMGSAGPAENLLAPMMCNVDQVEPDVD